MTALSAAGGSPELGGDAGAVVVAADEARPGDPLPLVSPIPPSVGMANTEVSEGVRLDEK